MAIHDALRATEALVRQTDGSGRVYAYQDDIDVLGHPTAMGHAARPLIDALAEKGLEFNMDKTWLWAGPAVVAETSALQTSLGCKAQAEPIVLRKTVRRSTLGQTAAGAPATVPDPATGAVHDPHAEEMATLIKNRRDLAAKLLRLNKDGLARRTASSLLRVASASDATWVMRTSGVPKQVAEQLDADLAEAAKELCGLTGATETQTRALFVLVRDGGFGFQSAVLQSRPALCASWICCAERAADRLGTSVAAMRPDLPILEWAHKTMETLWGSINTGGRPPPLRRET